MPPAASTAMKMVLADPKTGKSYKIELDTTKQKDIIGKRIGTEMDAEFAGLPGYTMKITGGTDKSGFVMKGDLPGPAKRRILGASGVGFAPKINGQRRRKFVRGNEISVDTSQINAKIIGYGAKSIEKLLGLEPEEEEPVAEEEAVEEVAEEEAVEEVAEEEAVEEVAEEEAVEEVAEEEAVEEIAEEEAPVEEEEEVAEEVAEEAAAEEEEEK